MKDALARRIAIERRVVRHLLRTAKQAGWDLAFIYDGEARNRCATEREAMSLVFNLDDCFIHFRKPVQVSDGVVSVKKAWARIVLGNDGHDAICDYSAVPMFEGEVMEASNRYCDAQEAA